MARILFLGEITGRPGITALRKGLSSLKTEYGIDYTIANGEGMTNGFGIGKIHSIQLGKMGVDLITGAEKLFYKIDMVEFIPKAGFIIRPVNYPAACPGHGIKHAVINNRKFMIVNLQGNSEFPRQSLQNAFYSIDSLLRKCEENADKEIPIVIFHAATVIGTHTKVLTADEMVTEKGTAYITDTGRVGSFLSVSGFDPETEIRKLRSQLPVRSQECWNDGIIEGAVVEIDEETGKAIKIERVAKHIAIEKPEDKKNETDGNDSGK